MLWVFDCVGRTVEAKQPRSTNEIHICASLMQCSLCVQSQTMLSVQFMLVTLTLKVSLLPSERDTLMRFPEANLVFEYHMRPPSERRTIVAFSVISSTCRAKLALVTTSSVTIKACADWEGPHKERCFGCWRCLAQIPVFTSYST